MRPLPTPDVVVFETASLSPLKQLSNFLVVQDTLGLLFFKYSRKQRYKPRKRNRLLLLFSFRQFVKIMPRTLVMISIEHILLTFLVQNAEPKHFQSLWSNNISPILFYNQNVVIWWDKVSSYHCLAQCVSEGTYCPWCTLLTSSFLTWRDHLTFRPAPLLRPLLSNWTTGWRFFVVVSDLFFKNET